MENRQCAVFKRPREHRLCPRHDGIDEGINQASNRQCAIHCNAAAHSFLINRGIREAPRHLCNGMQVPTDLNNLLAKPVGHHYAPQDFSAKLPMVSHDIYSSPGPYPQNARIIHDQDDLRDPYFVPRKPPVPLSNSLSINCFDTLSTLGTGAFGRVKLARCKFSGKYCVLKILSKFNVFKLKQVEHTRSERTVLSTIKHPFIVELYTTFQDDYRLYFVLEFVQGGELFFLIRTRGRFNETMTRFYASEVVCALEYLHSHKIVYRDLKPENVLITKTGHIKLTDFGFSKYVYDATWTLCGTPDYLAPEILLNLPYGKTVDWWALGVLLYEMLTGRPPFYDENRIHLYEKIITCQVSYPQYLTTAAAAIIGHLLEPDLTKRYGNLLNGAEDIKSDMWFQGIDWDLANSGKLKPPYIPFTTSDHDTRNFDHYDENSPEDLASFIIPEPYSDVFDDF